MTTELQLFVQLAALERNVNSDSVFENTGKNCFSFTAVPKRSETSSTAFQEFLTPLSGVLPRRWLDSRLVFLKDDLDRR
jgi:hypothetical protein